MRRLGLLALLLALAAVAVSPSAMAAFPGKNGRIVFSKSGRNSSPLYSVNPDGSGLRRITHGHYDSDPTVAPDGGRVAFDRDKGIYSVDTSGRHLKRLTSDNASEPAFSGPLGRRIAFTHWNSVTSTIWLMQSDGTNGRAVTHPRTADRAAAFSPDGEWIAFQRGYHDHSKDEIWRVRPDGTGLRRLIAPGNDPGQMDIAPDGRFIVYGHLSKHSHFVIALMRANGTHSRNLGPGRDPAFSPSGKRIAFTRREHVYTMNRHGRDLRLVTPHSWGAADPVWAARNGAG